MLEQSYYDKADEIIRQHGTVQRFLIPIIQDIQNYYRYLPPELLSYVAKRLGINEAKAYSVATFYENFSFEAKGKYVVRVCDGTACHVRKSTAILDQIYKETGLGRGKSTTCLGACGLAPVLTVNDVVHPAMTPEKVHELFEELKGAEKE